MEKNSIKVISDDIFRLRTRSQKLKTITNKFKNYSEHFLNFKLSSEMLNHIVNYS